jgi:hypothetical protein
MLREGNSDAVPRIDAKAALTSSPWWFRTTSWRVLLEGGSAKAASRKSDNNSSRMLMMLAINCQLLARDVTSAPSVTPDTAVERWDDNLFTVLVQEDELEGVARGRLRKRSVEKKRRFPLLCPPPRHLRKQRGT